MAHDVPAYLRLPLARTLDTEVVSAHADGGTWIICLRDELLRPAGGGQPRDRGTVDGQPVLDVRRREDGAILYAVGERPRGIVRVDVDLEHRFDLSQQHTAQH